MISWTTVLQKTEPGKDPDRYVQVRDGAIHMYADTDLAATVPFGVIVHEKTFSRFHLSLEYRWGEKKFAPRKDTLRDAGVIYHASNTGKVWPDSVEFQIQEGDTGDIVFLPKAGLTWMRPDPENAPQGQGEPGMLPEDGGFPKDFGGTGFGYIGRFPVLDTLVGGASFTEFDAPDKPFAFYMKGPKFDSFSDPAFQTTADIPHTGRIYPVSFYQGRKMEDSWLVGFEEAANGDYQDGLFLIENAVPAK